MECVQPDASGARALCGGNAPEPVCLQPCDGSGCASGQRCVAGTCVPQGGEAGSGGESGTGAAAGAAAGTGSAAGAGAGTSAGTGSAGGTGAGTGATAGAGGGAGTGDAGSGLACTRAGCSGQLCAAVGEEVNSDCDWREEYACYAAAECTAQSDGLCGWTQTPELRSCLEAVQSPLQWYRTCGDPVCGPALDAGTAQADCSASLEGSECDQPGSQCDPGLGCGVQLLCSDADPTMGPGGCPRSRAHFKQDVSYLGPQELQHFAQQALHIPLATYRYRADPSGRTHLGFIMEDVEPSVCADSDRGRVDLYGYTSMALAALKLQDQQLKTMAQELEALRARLAELESTRGRSQKNP